MPTLIKRWEAITRMNLALMRLAHVAYFPRTLTIADSLILRVAMQHIFVWQIEGRPATVSKIARAIGWSRATARRKLGELVEYGYVEQRGRFYRCSEEMTRLQEAPALLGRYMTIISHTCKQLEHTEE